MHKLHIENFGPIKNCEFNITEFLVLTGIQASGKSTIAKTVFYFRTIKNKILLTMLKFFRNYIFHQQAASEIILNPALTEVIQKELRKQFIEVFGTSWEKQHGMELVYYYNKNTWIKIVSCKEEAESFYENIANKIFSIEFSDDIKYYLEDYEKHGIPEEKDVTVLEYELKLLFNDEYNTIYIPAGREMITLLASQLDYLFMIMDDAQKSSIDYCTRTYLEELKKIKPQYENGLHGLYQNKIIISGIDEDKKPLKKMLCLIDEILKGKYIFKSGEDRLLIEDGKFIKMNYASSGQQESVWILNIIFYYTLEKKKTFLVLEEPESHLYPETQKKMAELIALFINTGNSSLVTTHSPYLLGSFNNLLYAAFIGSANEIKTDKVIPKEYWLSRQKTEAFYVSGGKVSNIMEDGLPLIKNETIDGISNVINLENELLLEIQMEEQ